MNKISKNKTDRYWGRYNCRNFIISDNLVTLITLILASQLLAIEASKKVAQRDLLPERNLIEKVPITPAQEINLEPQTPSNSSSKLDDVKPQDFPINSQIAIEHNLHVKITELLRQEILDQFKVINHDLQELSEELHPTKSNKKPLKEKSRKNSLILKLSKSLPIDETEMCEVEHSVLNNFQSELQASLNGTNQANSNTNCPLNDNTDTCEELIKLILCGYNHLKNAFDLATRSSAAVNECNMWKNKLEEYKEKSTRVLDDKITSLSQKYNLQIDNLKTDLQNLQNKANLYIKIIKEDGLEVCSFRIISGNIQDAVDKFKQLKDEFGSLEDFMIRSILKTIYSFERLENIMNFLRKLPDCSQDRISYPILYDLMQANNHLNSPEMLVLSGTLSQCMNSSELLTKVDANVLKILDSWANKIQKTNDHKQIIAFAKKYYSPFKTKLDELILKAYDKNLSNVEKILEFIRSLPYINHGIVGLDALFNGMSSNKHFDSYELVMLAYRIKEFMDMPNDPKGPQQNEHDNIIRKLKNNLPNSVQRLIWHGDECSVKNRAHNEYLFGSRIQLDSSRGKIFTWKEGVKTIESFWEFETEDNAKSFSMKNTHWDKYMYAANFSKNYARRWVLYWKEGGKVNQGFWKLKPVNNAKYFTIKNTKHDEYLYADGNKRQSHDSKRRGVYTWRNGDLKGVMVQEGQWEINC
ncbi:uncharacterized protein LOC129788863 [Lutzomyia longipalpis]|uniref:uncharacterized protein LOC129788863 n=1 Tax=Lutzomyia longipalpis TaxID=7200 RepID=UPI0024846EA8|nr:uncharacterized protein LOC129788863 [Lutzomyia longipalpis]